MAKTKKENVAQDVVQAETVEQKVSRLEAENAELNATISDLQVPQMSNADSNLKQYMDEMAAIKQTARVDTMRIKVQEITDHKNISLWTKGGKRIGPMHQANALYVFQEFWKAGERLTTKQPTAEQIEAYHKTDEYKVKHAKHLATRERKEASRKKGVMEKFAKEIAKMSGSTVEAINNILAPQNIVKMAEGLKKAGVIK